MIIWQVKPPETLGKDTLSEHLCNFNYHNTPSLEKMTLMTENWHRVQSVEALFVMTGAISDCLTFTQFTVSAIKFHPNVHSVVGYLFTWMSCFDSSEILTFSCGTSL